MRFSGLAGVGALRELPKRVDAIVSLCRVGVADVHRDVPHVEFRLIDGESPDDNPILDYVLSDAANTIAQLRQEGRTVPLHCVAAFSRTPTVAALYGARLRSVGTEEAVTAVGVALAAAWPNLALRAALQRLSVQ
jgi:ADP-ribosyl-[dinitrogen reductase] hydrolase